MKKVLSVILVSCLILTGCGKVEEKLKEESKTSSEDIVMNYKQTMKGLTNYTVQIESETTLIYPDRTYPSSGTTIYQVDLENQKIFNPSNLIYYDMKNKDVYKTEGITSDQFLDNLLIGEKYNQNGYILNEELFTFAYLDSNYAIEKMNDNQFKLVFKNDQDFIEFVKKVNNTSTFENETFQEKEVIIEGTDKYINTLTITYTTTGKNYEEEDYTRKEIKTFCYRNFKVTSVPEDVQIIHDQVAELLNKTVTSSFTENINGEEHTFNVTYKFNIFGGVVANAEISMDNKKINNYQYMFRLDDVSTLEDLVNYKTSDLDKKLKNDNFYIIQGDKEQYIAMYSSLLTEIGDMSKLYVFDGKGKLVVELQDKTTISIDPLSNYEPHGFTKVEDDSITFYTYRKKDQIDSDPYKYVISEYKLTFEDGLKYEKINTYSDIDASGDVTYFNDIIK